MKRLRCLTLISFLLLNLTMKGALKEQVWGTTSTGEPVRLFTLSDANIRVRLIEYGARIVSIEIPDRRGQRADIVLGHNSLAEYLSDPKDYFGAVVGRYGNRIANASFNLPGNTYHIPPNDNGNALHGGPAGFNTKVWKGRIVGTDTVEFTLVSPDGDMGFPGALTVNVRYTLAGNELRIAYEAITTKTTIVNLTNHSFFNLAGEASGDVLQHELRINSNRITAVDSKLIPTGEIDTIRGTPFDFLQLTPIGQRIGSQNEQMKYAGGYDHNYVLNGKSGTLRKAAYAVDPGSGRTLTVLTTEPGLQFYSGNRLDGSKTGYSGKRYQKYAGFCLETQHFPDSPHHPNFPSTTLEPDMLYRSVTEFVFGTLRTLNP